MSIINSLIRSGSLTTVQNLYKCNAQLSPNMIEGSEQSHLVMAVVCQQLKMLKFLMTWNAVTRDNSATPGECIAPENLKSAIIEAVSQGYVEMVQYFLNEAGWKADGVLDINKNTVLHIACMHQQHAVVTMLLGLSEAGKLTRSKNMQKQCPLHVAVVTGHEAITAALIEKNIRAKTSKDNQGKTPFMLATEYHREKIAIRLQPKEKKRKRKDAASSTADSTAKRVAKVKDNTAYNKEISQISDGEQSLSPWSLFMKRMQNTESKTLNN